MITLIVFQIDNRIKSGAKGRGSSVRISRYHNIRFNMYFSLFSLAVIVLYCFQTQNPGIHEKFTSTKNSERHVCCVIFRLNKELTLIGMWWRENFQWGQAPSWNWIQFTKILQKGNKISVYRKFYTKYNVVSFLFKKFLKWSWF